jgi:hypothetical protein
LRLQPPGEGPSAQRSLTGCGRRVPLKPRSISPWREETQHQLLPQGGAPTEGR